MRDKDHAYTSGAAWRSCIIECAGNAHVNEAYENSTLYLSSGSVTMWPEFGGSMCLVVIVDRGEQRFWSVCSDLYPARCLTDHRMHFDWFYLGFCRCGLLQCM